jgi:glycosyltransferase involved in cell wall biosynthesis
VLRWRPHVIHVHDLLSPASIGLLSAGLLRVPVVALVASTGPGGDIDRLLHKPLGARRLRRIVRDVAAFHTLADEVEDELTGHGVPRERLWRIPNGVDTERFRPGTGDERRATRERLAIPPDAVVSIYCGRFAPVKRLDVLLDAFLDVPGHLVLVGNGSEQDRVLARARDAGLAGRVHVLPAVGDPAPLLRAADLYVSASSTEGMSNSVLEAMASGLPIAASPASGMGEIVTAATGVLAADTGASRLGAAIATIAGDRRLREQRGAAARELIVSRYSLQSTADLLVALYRRLAAADARQAQGATTVPPAA